MPSIPRISILSLLFIFLLASCAPTPSSVATQAPVATAQSAVASTPTQAAQEPTKAQSNGPAATQAVQPTAVSPAPAEQATQSNSTSSSSSNGNLVFAIVPDQSSVNYRVREQLVGRDLPNDAIGKTSAIMGSISINPEGTIDSANSKIVVDVSTLTSDQDRRDNFLRRSTLQSSQYPQVTFVPTQVTGLTSPLPQSGDFTFQIIGDMTVRDVTKPVTWDVTGTIQNGQIKAHATTTFTFEDFNLSQPRVPVVLSVEDKIVLEVDLVLQQQ